MITLSALAVFPVKSLRGVPVAAAQVEPWGLRGDRRFVVLDPAGRFITQRECHAMVLVDAGPDADGGVTLSMAGHATLRVAVPDADAPVLRARVWRDEVPARDAGDAAASWLSAAIATPCRLAYLADPAHDRMLAAAYAANGAESVSFADAFPVLLTGTASLDDLNTRLPAPVPMLRFRPNLVVRGAPAWAEDGWRRLRIGGVIFRVAKPCDRCVMTSIDPETGLRPDPVEPIRTLGTFRRDRRGGVMFGQNLVPENTGTIRAGDTVEILQSGAPNVQLAQDGA